jgi:hypothetical protein
MNETSNREKLLAALEDVWDYAKLDAHDPQIGARQRALNEGLEDVGSVLDSYGNFVKLQTALIILATIDWSEFPGLYKKMPWDELDRICKKEK